MRALLEMRADPIDEEDQNYFKRANKFTTAFGCVEQVLVNFSESLTDDELKKQILERMACLRKEIAEKKRVVIDESEADPDTGRVQHKYRVREGTPISDDEVKEMRQFLRIGFMVLESPEDLGLQVKSIFEEILEDQNE